MSRADGELAKRNILRITGLDDIEQARVGWKVIDIGDSDAPDFVGICELCNQPELRLNYVLIHDETQATMRVGSTCVRRFVFETELVRMSGASTREQSEAIFNADAKRLAYRNILRALANALVGEKVHFDDLREFRRSAAKFFDVTEEYFNQHGYALQDQMPNTWQRLLDIVAPNGEEAIIDAVEKALFRPHGLRIVRDDDNKPQISDDEKWSREQWMKRARRVETTLARSEAYMDPKKRRMGNG